MLDLDSEEARWHIATIDAFKPLKEETDWLACPQCHRKPRVWVFDNGNYARCQCGKKYENSAIEFESIGDYYRRKKTCEGYNQNGLREKWNEHVHTHKLSIARAQLMQVETQDIELF